IYAAAIVLLGLVPVNQSFAQTPETSQSIEIMVLDNGVDTDLVLPAKTAIIDWRDYLHLQDFPGADPGFSHFAFGWGNRRFYMETPEWTDLSLDVALSAALGIGKSAMHVYYLPKAPPPGEKRILLKLSPVQYERLVHYIFNSFQQDENGRFLLIKSKGYTATDNFYAATGRFSLLKSCNGWTNGALKNAGIKTVAWAPLPHFMMRKLRKLNQ